MIAGINYPWTVVDGRANYGCDFGRNIWNGHSWSCLTTPGCTNPHARRSALAQDGGYLGAWPWSVKGVDAFGAVGRR